ncbi:MAG: methionine adenosyltransferase [Bdellovibrio sp.]|nr:methionine adenosyltransferase [Bdellovibrio sp.]
MRENSSWRSKKFLFTSESVVEGHPDKICDQISDAVLDEVLRNDPRGHVACECLVTTELLHVAGEVLSDVPLDIDKIARSVIADIGYLDEKLGFSATTCRIINSLQTQSEDIVLGISESMEARNHPRDSFDLVGAGDQGMMIGYATNESSNYLPLPINLAHQLAQNLAAVRKTKLLPYLRPDGKTQVTVEYEHGKVQRVDTIIVSAQHGPDIAQEMLRHDILNNVILKSIPAYLIDSSTKIYINPTGRFVKGGPHGDTGLTGRKILVDTYGGMSRHGGGCFSGKDPTKVDRSGAYMLRYVAKNLVAAGVADTLELQVAYSIARANPVSLMIETFGTGNIPDEKIREIIDHKFDLRPAAIIERLNLQRPIYRRTTNYGHFGREEDFFTWEFLDMVDEIKKYL